MVELKSFKKFWKKQDAQASKNAERLLELLSKDYKPKEVNTMTHLDREKQATKELSTELTKKLISLFPYLEHCSWTLRINDGAGLNFQVDNGDERFEFGLELEDI